MGGLISIVLILIIAYLYHKYDFAFDITVTGDFLLWYTNEEGERTYKKLNV